MRVTATINVVDASNYTEQVSASVTLDTDNYPSLAGKEEVKPNPYFEIANAMMHLMNGLGYSKQAIVRELNKMIEEDFPQGRDKEQE